MHDIRENKEELSRLLGALGNALASLLPGGWREAVAGCFFVGEEQAPQLQLHAVLPGTRLEQPGGLSRPLLDSQVRREKGQMFHDLTQIVQRQ